MLQACYHFEQPNKTCVLTRRKASVTIRGQVHEVEVKVQLRPLPSPSIEIEGALPVSFGILRLDSVDNLAIDGRDIPGFLTRTPFSSSSGSRFVWDLKREPTVVVGTSNTKMTRVVFHAFNYMDFQGTRRSSEETSSGFHAIQHVDLSAGGWHVELKSLPNTSSAFKALRETGGSALTHVGSLQKEDGAPFAAEAAVNTLSALRDFFSFSRGMWCNPCLAVGFDKREERVWESLSSPAQPWDSPDSWFDPHHCEQLQKLFPGFMTKWAHEDWRKALHETIYFYLNSNSSRRGIDAGIILAQAALERLSFEYAVKHKRLVEIEGFKNLRASDKFRLLFSSLNIPIDIPNSLPELRKLGAQFGWLDAPHAITEIRNSLVHPEHKRRGQFGKAFFPAWNLGQWYLELALLRICDYSGTYANRLTPDKYVGTVEPVPWE